MTEVAVLGGGCFWCTESVFKALRGVLEVTPGYSGGHVEHPTYEQVCQQGTGHIEVVKVVFDPDVINFKALLQVFFATHDPLTLNQQGADVGPQYASAIFCQTEQQNAVAREVIDEVEAALGAPVVTRLLAAEHFWPAESYHHNYYEQHSSQGYCQVVISPKLAKLRQKFAPLLQR